MPYKVRVRRTGSFASSPWQTACGDGGQPSVSETVWKARTFWPSLAGFGRGISKSVDSNLDFRLLFFSEMLFRSQTSMCRACLRTLLIKRDLCSRRRKSGQNKLLQNKVLLVGSILYQSQTSARSLELLHLSIAPPCPLLFFVSSFNSFCLRKRNTHLFFLFFFIS